MKSTIKLVFAAAAAATFLAACGGGGGGGSSTPSNPSTPATPSTPSTPVAGSGVAPQTTVAPTTYDSTTFQAAAYQIVNTYRNNMGVGTLKQDPILDTAAAAHALYLFSNLAAGVITTLPHTEVAGQANYYGDDPLSRAQKAGAPTSEWIAENVAAGVQQPSVTAAAQDCIGQALASVYHLIGLTNNQETIGLGFQPGTSAYPIYTCVSDFGTSTGVVGTPTTTEYSYAGGQQISTDTIVSSPYANETGVATLMRAESPNPAADIAAPGRPIIVRVNAQNRDTLTVGQFILKDANGNVVATRILVPQSAQSGSTATTVADPNGLLPNGTAVLLPLAALQANTTYTVTFSGARDGVAMTKSWPFTTGS